jgi:nicotinamide-nucleotide amidase
MDTNLSDHALVARAACLIGASIDKGIRIATAESCTGGLLAGLLTEIPGSSAVLDRGFVTYSNEAKTQMIGVPAELIETRGAVSAEVACAMAEGALRHSRANLTIAITGIAGPGGGSPAKPVGLVHFARACRHGQTQTYEKRFKDEGRAAIRRAALDFALTLLEEEVAKA